MTKVVNINSHEPTDHDVYIGRRDGPYHYGNPFSHLKSSIAQVKVKSRTQAIELFRDWILGLEYQDIEPVRRQWILDNISSLKDKNLVCYCYPKDCHGDVYIEFLDMSEEDIENLRRQKEETHSPQSIWDIMCD